MHRYCAVLLRLFLLLGLLSVRVAHAANSVDAPFDDTFWNKPLQPGATYVHARLSATTYPHVDLEQVFRIEIDLSDPVRHVYRSTVEQNFDNICDQTGLTTNELNFDIAIPNSFTITSNVSNNILIACLRSGCLNNFGCAGTCREAFFTRKCTSWTGALAGQLVNSFGCGRPDGTGCHTAAQLVTSNGLARGAHLGGGNTAIAGTIFPGELTTAVGVKRGRMLAIDMPANSLYYRTTDPYPNGGPGHRWPAFKADTYAPNAYISTNRELRMGSVMALKPDYDCDGQMVTEPAWKLCKDFQEYGALVVDTYGPNYKAWSVIATAASPTKPSVASQVLSAYGISMVCFSGCNAATTNYKADMHRIWESLHVVSNISPTAPKGPGGVAVVNTYYVNGSTGNDSNTCIQAGSSSTPKATIAAGIGCLSAGKSLVIAAGTYTEAINDTIPTGTSASQVYIRAASGATVTLRPTASTDVFRTTKSYINITGLVLDATNLTSTGAALNLDANAQHITVSSTTAKATPNSACVVVHRATDAIALSTMTITDCNGASGHGVSWAGPNGLLQDSTISNTDGAGISLNTTLGSVYNTTIRRNLIHDTTGAAIALGNLTGVNLIVNNIAYTVATGITYYGNTGNKVYHNTLSAVTGAPFTDLGSGTSIDIRNNLAWPYGSGSVPAGNLGTDPLFTDADAHTYTLTAQSPAIDTGVTLTAVTTDYANTVRPLGQSSDMGAYESTAVARILVDWDEPSSPTTPVQQYIVERALAQGTYQQRATTSASVTQTYDTVVQNGSWCYRVKAGYSSETSAPTTPVCVTVDLTAPAPPTTPPPTPLPVPEDPTGGLPPVEVPLIGSNDPAYTRPFDPTTSIYKLAFGDGAIIVPAQLSSTTLTGSNYVEPVTLVRLAAADPLRNIVSAILLSPILQTSATCSTIGVYASQVKFPVRLPDTFTQQSRVNANAAVFCDVDNVVAGFGGALTCREIDQFRRCSESFWTGTLLGLGAGAGTGSLTTHGTVDAYSLTGDGLSHDASTCGAGAFQGNEGGCLKALGGLIRQGELISAAGVEIPHMLALAMSPSRLYSTYRYPAVGIGNPSVLTGTNPNISIGSILTLLPTFDCRERTITELGWKVCRATQKYGALIVTPTLTTTSTWGWTIEQASETSRTVRDEVLTTHGITLGCRSGCSATTESYRNDLNTILDNLYVATNITAANPKGPGAIAIEDIPPDEDAVTVGSPTNCHSCGG